MDPVVTGAIIGAVPALLAAGLAAWATSRVSNRTLAADNAKWLREKRADIYVDTIRAFHQAQGWANGIESGDTRETLKVILEERKEFLSDRASDYTARLFAFGSRNSYDAAISAWDAERALWKVVGTLIKDGGKIGSNDDSVTGYQKDFKDKIPIFLNLVVADLQSIK